MAWKDFDFDLQWSSSSKISKFGSNRKWLEVRKSFKFSRGFSTVILLVFFEIARTFLDFFQNHLLLYRYVLSIYFVGPVGPVFSKLVESVNGVV